MNIDTTHDHHMHSVFSDGSSSIEALADSAVKKGLSRITITDHMPLPFDTRYAMAENRIAAYRASVVTAQEKYSGRLDIDMGIEMEYVPEYQSWMDSILEKGWEVSIISIHRLMVNGIYRMVNGTVEEFDLLLQGFNMDIQALYRAYYKTAQAAFETGRFDIAGHLDVFKKHNVNQIYFDESDPVYRDLVLETLDTMRKQDMKMEINMGGFNHPVGEQYPSLWIIREAVNRRIPIVLSSDSHCPDTLGQHFDRAAEMVRKKGAISAD